MQLQAGTLLQGGKYKIIRFIKNGGFGCTYEAEHVMLGKRIAIKEFFVKDFCERDEVTQGVTIVTQSKKKLVLKLKRKFIDEAVAIGALLVSRAVGYLRMVADAFQYILTQNRLHLDIKPGNVMVDRQGNTVLIDFGVSKQYDEESGENTSTLMGVTPGYAPLEQMGNDVVKFMPATDLYALGATLYKLLTGKTPITASMRASGEELPPLPVSVSDSVCQAVHHAMLLNKHNRTQSVTEFLKQLNAEKKEEKKCDDDTVLDEKKDAGNDDKKEKESNAVFSSFLQSNRKLFIFLAVSIGIMFSLVFMNHVVRMNKGGGYHESLNYSYDSILHSEQAYDESVWDSTAAFSDSLAADSTVWF